MSRKHLNVMKNEQAILTEKLYNRRFRFNIGLTAGRAVYFGTEIAEPYFPDTGGTLLWIKLAAAAVAILFIVLLGRDEKTAKKNPQIRAALNDELYERQQLRAAKWGFLVAIATSLLIGLSPLAHQFLSVRQACFIILLATTLGAMIPLLIYMKR